jgi:hypothetical protein
VSDKVHIAPVWRDRADSILATRLEEGYAEQLWGRRLGERTFELCCIPLFAYDLALGDVVETDDSFDVLRVVEPSGRFVFRAWFTEAPERAEPVVAELSNLGCLVEQGSQHLYAIDAESRTLAEAAAACLAKEERTSGVLYETGRA